MSAVAVALLLALGPARREDNPHYRDAVAAWDAGDWDAAARAFAAAYEIDPRAEYVFAGARAHRNGGNCASAVPLFERFIALAPPKDAIADAELNLRECRAVLAASAPKPEPPPPRPVDVSPAPAPRPSAARDPWGHALTWPGLAVLGVGVGLLADAHARANRADGVDEQRYRDLLHGAPARSQAGIALATIGGAALVAGIVRFAVVAARKRDASPRAVAGTR
ncbi:MAG TPA: hypothetical protein VG755_10470 [Nannocystaceae bacterium]|nr:hypothetical protein [Nannocystaceae bacterium]